MVNTKRETVKMLELMTSFVGEPRSHWIGNHWIPAEGSRLYTPDEMRILYEQECTLFIGDSLQRRAAETLGIALKTNMMDTKQWLQNKSALIANRTVTHHTPDIPESDFLDELFNTNIHERQYEEHFMTNNNKLPGVVPMDANASTTRGCICTSWKPQFSSFQESISQFSNESFRFRFAKVTVVVVGLGIWDVHLSPRRNTSADDLAKVVNETIYSLDEHIAKDKLLVFKSAGWCPTCPWDPEISKRSVVENYKVWRINKQAEETIATIASNRIVFVDWAREVLPRSIGHMKIESKDENPYHYGLLARLQFIQMLTEVLDKRKPWLLNPEHVQSSEGCTSIPKTGRSSLPLSEARTIDFALGLQTFAAIGAVILFFAGVILQKCMRKGTRP